MDRLSSSAKGQTLRVIQLKFNVNEYLFKQFSLKSFFQVITRMIIKQGFN